MIVLECQKLEFNTSGNAWYTNLNFRKLIELVFRIKNSYNKYIRKNRTYDL